MSLIKHSDAISLEHILRRVYNCDRCGVAGLVDADVFESNPYYAALLTVTPIYYSGMSKDDHEISDFLFRYGVVFNYPDENLNDEAIEKYISELRALVNKYY